MSEAEQKKIKLQLIKALKDEGIYNKAIDDILIDNIVFNLTLIANAKTDIATRGQMINLRKAGEDPFYQINFSVSIFHNSVKSVNTLLKQLGLEKKEVKNDPQEDAFNNLQRLLN